MYYCFPYKKISDDLVEEEINRAIRSKKFIYYDETSNKFLNELDQEINVKNLNIIPLCDIDSLSIIINALLSQEAKLPNNMEDINKIEEWYKYIEPERDIISFTGSMLNDNSFLTYLLESFTKERKSSEEQPKIECEVFLKTKKKNFNGIIDFSEIFDSESDLRKAFSYHENEEFIIAPKVIIDEDELGKKEYRCFIYDGKIMNISRILDTTYHKIPKEVLDYIEKILKEIPQDFPSTFVLDIFSYNNTLDILEFNPFEASGKYLYNSVFEFSNDLLHEEETKIPIEKNKLPVSNQPHEKMKPTIRNNIKNSFAKDYMDIKLTGKRSEENIENLLESSKHNPTLAKALKIFTQEEND